MTRISSIGIALLSLLLTAASAVAQQPPAGKTSYTFVAEWQIARMQWGGFESDFDKNTRPVLEKLAANGTLTGWHLASGLSFRESRTRFRKSASAHGWMSSGLRS